MTKTTSRIPFTSKCHNIYDTCETANPTTVNNTFCTICVTSVYTV